MRATVCTLLLLAAVSANAEPLAAKASPKDDACKAVGTSEILAMTLPFGNAVNVSAEAGHVRVPFKADAQIESDPTHCFWWKIVTFYTDATLTQSCGSLTYFCDGLVGSGGPCRTAFTTIRTCECFEEGF